jgi:hypothetical protein
MSHENVTAVRAPRAPANSKEARGVEMGVMAQNANGAPEVFFCRIHCSEQDRDNGEHYERAKQLARDAGYEPMLAFDESDPAWAQIGQARFYKDFFHNAFESLQDAFVGGEGRAIGGADTVDLVAEVFGGALQRNQVGAPRSLYFVMSADGYWDNNEGWCDTAAHVFLSPNPLRFEGMTGSCVSVVAVPLEDRDELETLCPQMEEINDAADAALERSRKYGFSIGQDNAAEVMREELKLGGRDDEVPTWLDEFLGAVILARAEVESEQQRRPGGER